MRQVCRIPLFFDLLKDLIIWVMTFVDEDGSHPLKIAVGFYVNHGSADYHHHYFDSTLTLLLPQVVIQC